jgi:nucleoside phosphorylase
MILIHTALFSEAKPLIDYFNLKQYDTKPYKIFKNSSIVLIVSGVGKINTNNALDIVFEKYKFTNAFNLGTAGSSNTDINIGDIFCTNQKIKNIDFKELKTVDFAKKSIDKKVCLYDMEAKYFLIKCLNYLENKDIFVLKIVSDYCDDKICKKEFVYKIINNTSNKWGELINGYK